MVRACLPTYYPSPVSDRQSKILCERRNCRSYVLQLAQLGAQSTVFNDPPDEVRPQLYALREPEKADYSGNHDRLSDTRRSTHAGHR